MDAPSLGLRKATEYTLEDSNMELVGSDVDHKVKYASAAAEPAWQAPGIGTSPGQWVWRIESFEVVPVLDKQGVFFRGDSYVVLHSYGTKVLEGETEEEKLRHEIFFWLGRETTADEAGTAAYKTVELDEFLGGMATQERETEGNESAEFTALFGGRIKIMKGGVKSGFRHIEMPGDDGEDSVITLLRVFKDGRSGVRIVEVEPNYKSLDKGDVFVLETEMKVIIWQGKDCSPMERARGIMVGREIGAEGHKGVEVVEQGEFSGREVVRMLGNREEGISLELVCPRPVGPGEEDGQGEGKGKRLWRLSDDSGNLEFELVKDNGEEVGRKDLWSSDVFVLDVNNDKDRRIWVWEGRGASERERKAWLKIAREYLQKERVVQGGVSMAPIAKVREGLEGHAFLAALGA